MSHRSLAAMLLPVAVTLLACEHKVIIQEVPAEDDAALAAPPPSPPPAKVPADAAKAAAPPSSQPSPSGRLVLQATESTNPDFAKYVSGIGQSQVLTDAIGLFNRKFTFPRDVPVVTQDCGVVNSFYVPDQHAIVLCYELMDALASVYPVVQDGITPEAQWNILAQQVSFLALHEAGHAFIAENQIPMLGREEDVVDEISGVTFVSGKEPSVPLVGTEGMLNVFVDTSFANEHSRSQQRYFDMLCLIYGSDPATFAAYVGDEASGLLPQERAANCPHEWSQKSEALNTLASKFLRQ